MRARRTRRRSGGRSMLGQLDTFIAFAVVILGISLLITVLNQIIVALFGLRGSSLRWGLETLLEEMHHDLAPYARHISELVLQHPLISDSTVSKTHSWPLVGPFLGRWRNASAIKVGELNEILRKLAGTAAENDEPKWKTELRTMLAHHDEQR